jgi:hypothetical protein
MDVQGDGMAGAPEDTGKKTGRKRGRPAAPAEVEKVSLNLRVDRASYVKLNLHALMLKKNVSQLVMEYAATLKEFSVHRNASRDGREG